MAFHLQAVEEHLEPFQLRWEGLTTLMGKISMLDHLPD
jgi:hypothetical protein